MIGFLVTIPNLGALAAMIFVSRSSDRTLERRYHVAIPAIMAGTALALLARISHNKLKKAVASWHNSFV
jgi:hypothetical protein